MSRVNAKTLFQKFRDDTVVSRCEQYAFWTLPYLMADPCELSSTGRVVVERDFQEVGALLTNNLAAKLTRLLFPQQYSFFKASANGGLKDWAKRKGVSAKDMNAMFANLEMNSKKRLFVNAGYASLILALKYLIITGNALIYRDTVAGKMTVWGPNAFVARRAGNGDLLECILKEYTTVEALPEDLQTVLRMSNRAKYSRPEQTVEKYTRIRRDFHNGVVGYSVSQEVDCIPVGEPSWSPANLCPWMCPTWNLIPGEHYGRGLVEDFAGGFAKLSALSESAALYDIEMMRVVHLVGAGAGTDIDELNTAESGQFVRGDAGQVQAYEAGDYKKAEQVEAKIQATFQRLAKAFMYQGQARQAERVTAYELQLEAQEAENALGGAISTLSGGIQVPMAHVLMAEVSREAEVGIILGELMPDITAGIDALGRSADVQNLIQASQEIAGIVPVAQLDKRLNSQRLVDVILAGRGIDPTTVFYTEAEQKANAEAEAAQQQAQAALLQAQTLADQGKQLQQL